MFLSAFFLSLSFGHEKELGKLSRLNRPKTKSEIDALLRIGTKRKTIGMHDVVLFLHGKPGMGTHRAPTLEGVQLAALNSLVGHR